MYSGWDLATDQSACDAATIIMYIFLAERVLSTTVAFNIDLLNSRISFLKDEQCYIGIQRRILIAPIVGEFVINDTETFSLKIQRRHNTISFGSADITRAASSLRLQKLLKRTALGSVITLIVTTGNLSALITLNGESAWLCILSCELDASINAAVLVWVTSSDNLSTSRDRPREPVLTSLEASEYSNPARVPVLQTHGLTSEPRNSSS
ncbi:hypothetical protein BX600DRAFT_441535 [Xylariales sp. PMI_506]|nr:hypothetical protein BX600DRAFT_441535 [Xylariales sp. PMI_506]